MSVVNQIAPIVNDIIDNLSMNTPKVIDTRTYVNFAQDVLSIEGQFDIVYNEILDKITKTAIAIRLFESKESDILVDEQEYGTGIEKISFEIVDAENNSSYTSPQNPYTVSPKSGIHVEYFQTEMGTFSFVDVEETKKLRLNFLNPQALAGFMSGLYTRMQNARNMSIDGLCIYAKNALYASVYNDTENVNYSNRVRKVLSEYNNLFGTNLTAESAIYNADFKRWLNAEWKLAKLTLANRNTKLFNDGSVERHTTEEYLHFDISARVATQYDVLYSDTFSPEYAMIPRHKEVVDFGEASNPNLVRVTIPGTGEEVESGVTVTIPYLIGAMYDHDAVFATFVNDRFVSIYDQWNDRTPFKMEADRRFCVSKSENCILWVME